MNNWISPDEYVLVFIQDEAHDNNLMVTVYTLSVFVLDVTKSSLMVIFSVSLHYHNQKVCKYSLNLILQESFLKCQMYFRFFRQRLLLKRQNRIWKQRM